MTRARWILLLGLAAGCSNGPSPPRITAVDYSPMQLPVDMTTTVGGSVSFEDADGDVAQIVLGFVTPAGALSEADPSDTATPGLLHAKVVWKLTMTPTMTGTYQLSIRLVDATGLSSPASLQPLDVR